MRLGILGHFGLGKQLLNGQTIKTKNLVDGIEKHTDISVCKIDSHGWIRHPFRLLRNIKNAFRECDAVVMLPAYKGVRIFAPILLHYKKKYKKKIFYDVIGGWLPQFLQDKPRLAKKLRQFDGVWVETSTMKKKLEELGFTNVAQIPNFKDLAPLSPDELRYSEEKPLRLCTFSRVMKEKGIEDAVSAVRAVNEAFGENVFSLDIYGQVWESYQERFEQIQKEFPPYVRYCGSVEASKSVEVLQDYFALLFPTRFYTEGIPGTIIDAYAAGIPVISAKWESYSDVVDEGKTGIGYEFDNEKQFTDILMSLAQNPKTLLDMKENCINKAKDYMPETAIKVITERFGGDNAIL